MFKLTPPSFPEPPELPGDWYCDFCGDSHEVNDIVAAPNKAAICGPCAQKCLDTLARAKPSAPVDPLDLGAAAGFRQPLQECALIALTRLPDGRAVLDIGSASHLLSADTVAALVEMFSRLPVIEKAGA